MHKDFMNQQRYITDRMYDKVLDNALECIMASSIFESNDYELLLKSLRTRIQRCTMCPNKF